MKLFFVRDVCYNFSDMLLTPKKIKQFREVIYSYYQTHGRQFPWRNTDNPYAILVSEIMLQQTQASRVLVKYEEFLHAFPTWKSLAHASLQNILKVWQGMGYNRRALALREIARRIQNDHKGQLPNNPTVLMKFPSIGPHTAGSICAFAFNRGTLFIETNIRTVFIHYFFQNITNIHDRELLPYIEATLDTKQPRIWYNALMDYGAYLKKEHKNPSRQSFHHVKQSAFANSDRQLRGQIIKQLTSSAYTRKQLINILNCDEHRITKLVTDLTNEGILERCKKKICIAS